LRCILLSINESSDIGEFAYDFIHVSDKFEPVSMYISVLFDVSIQLERQSPYWFNLIIHRLFNYLLSMEDGLKIAATELKAKPKDVIEFVANYTKKMAVETDQKYNQFHE